MPINDRPSTIASSLKVWDHGMYPNLHLLLKICVTIPVASHECERSGSVLSIPAYFPESINGINAVRCFGVVTY